MARREIHPSGKPAGLSPSDLPTRIRTSGLPYRKLSHKETRYKEIVPFELVEW